MWRLVALLLLCLSCAEGRDAGATPEDPAELPPLALTDDTPDLLLTWIDDKGGTHTGVTIAEVPAASRELVRVVTKDAGHGAALYVADLREKRADGTYAVRTMPRSEWEQLLAERREKWRAAHAPPPPPPRPPPEEPGTPSTGLTAIIYGASWCGPCHQAAAYLKRRGVTVVEHDIEKSPHAADEMQEKARRAGIRSASIPIIDVGGVVLQGFSPGALDRAIDRARRGPTAL
jgi:glutaredoxin